MKKHEQQLRSENPDRIKFLRSELPGLAQELEAMYNALASRGVEPSEKMKRLILWVKQEEAVLNHPDYDPDLKCETCGFGRG